MPISNNNFQGVGSPLPGIINALKTVNEVYGIKEAGLKAQQLEGQVNAQKIAADQQQQAIDPESPVSQLARQQNQSAMQLLVNKGFMSHNDFDNATKSISGTPAIPGMPIQGPLPESGESLGMSAETPATPGMSKAQLDASLNEGGPMVALAKAQMAADAAGAKARVFSDRLEETKNQNAAHAGKEFESDPIIKSAKISLNSLDRSQSILNNTSKPVTSKDLNLAYTDYINAVAAGGAASEGKIHRELPESFEAEWNNLKGKFGEYDDLRKTPAGAGLIDMLGKNISQVRYDLGNSVADQAQRIQQNFSQNTNQRLQKTVSGKVSDYQKFRTPAPDASSGDESVGPHGATVYQNHQMYQWNPKTKQYE